MWDTVTQASLRATYAKIERAYLGGDRSAECDREALAAGLRWLQDGFHPSDANVAAEKVYRLTDLALRLSAQRELLHPLADSVYEHRNVDTSRAHRGQFLLAIACLELNRNDYYLCEAAVDSALQQGRGRLEAGTTAGCYKIRGFAQSKLGRHAGAYRDFAEAAGLYGLSMNTVGQLSALEASARAAVLNGLFAEALDVTASAIALLSQMPGGEERIDEAYNVYLSRAKALAAVGRREEALAAVERGIAVAAHRQDRFRIVSAEIAAAEVAFALARFDESIKYAQAARDGATASRQNHLLYEALTVLGVSQKASGAYAAALQTTESILRLKDTIDARRFDYGLADLRARHHQQAVRQQLTLVKAEKVALEASRRRIESERWVLVLIVVASLLVLVGVFLQLRSRRGSQRRLRALVDVRTAEIAAQKAALVIQAESLRRSNVELERFAYIASHDLKTPIRNVASFLGLIERRLAPAARAEVQEYLDLASGYARQMHALVTDVLEFSKLDVDLETRSCAVDLAGMFDRLSRQLAPQFEARAASLEVSGDAEAWGPPNYVLQLFTNLVENGLKYNRSVYPRVQVMIAAVSADWVEVSVCDNGIGIAPDYHDKVFEMFKRLHTSDEFQGTGLGLAVCKKVIDRLGGGISLRSAEGEGSTFTVRLPAKPTAARSVVLAKAQLA